MEIKKNKKKENLMKSDENLMKLPFHQIFFFLFFFYFFLLKQKKGKSKYFKINLHD